MSLRQPIGIVPPSQLGHVHFIAIGGSMMSGLAHLYRQLGVQVSGCDRVDSPTLRALRAEGIAAHIGHDPAHLAGVDTVVISSAIRDTNPELVAAREGGLRVWHRSAALASLMIGRRVVSVAGTHGKTTTTAMTAVMLDTAGIHPSYVIGAPLAASGTSAMIGSGDVIVVEADESDGSFLQYPTQIAVITNVEADHLDNWGSPQHYAQGFAEFAEGPSVEAVVINVDDPGARALAERLAGASDRRRQLVTYGESVDAEVRIVEPVLVGTTAHAQLVVGGHAHALHLQVPGRHNLANAAAAFAVGRLLDLPADALLRGAEAFTGTLRRFQLVAVVENPRGPIRIYDDYAHHPTEIRAALTAARRAAGGGRLVACFQPHLYSRTRDFAEQFGQALALADVVVVTDVYAAREDPLPGVTGRLVAEAAGRAGAVTHYEPDKANLPGVLASLVRPGDLVMTLGAGDITLVGPLLARQLVEAP